MPDTSIETTPETAETRVPESIRYTCRGPLVLSPRLHELATAKREKLKGDHEQTLAFAKSLAKSMGHADRLTDESSVSDVEEQLVRLLKARKGCGVDKTALVEAVPFDGVTHIVTCPECGTEDPVTRTPRTPEEAQAAEAAKEDAIADVLK